MRMPLSDQSLDRRHVQPCHSVEQSSLHSCLPADSCSIRYPSRKRERTCSLHHPLCPCTPNEKIAEDGHFLRPRQTAREVAQRANPRTSQNRIAATPSATDFNANGAANQSHQRRARLKCDAPQNATIHRIGAPRIAKYAVGPTNHRSGINGNSALVAASAADAKKPTPIGAG